MMNFWLGFLFVFCFLKLGLVFVGICVDEENLYVFLFLGYNKEICFGMNRSIFFLFNIMFYLYFINDFDLNKGKFLLIVMFLLIWVDERFFWNLVVFNNINNIFIFQKKIWILNFVNINFYDDVIELRMDVLVVRVFSSGCCVWFVL